MSEERVTFLGAFLTRVSSRMSSNRNMYMSTAFDISTTNNDNRTVSSMWMGGEGSATVAILSHATRPEIDQWRRCVLTCHMEYRACAETVPMGWIAVCPYWNLWPLVRPSEIHLSCRFLWDNFMQVFQSDYGCQFCAWRAIK